MRALIATVALLALLPAAGCGDDDDAGSGPAAPPVRGSSDRFDADAAWRLIELQLDYGQRPAGSPQLRRLAEELRPMLPRGRFEPIPGEPGLRNIVGVIPGTKPGLVIGAHYDTLAEPKGFIGANNGAAGTAIVVQLAREAARMERPRLAPEIRFVLFDGEEPPDTLPEKTEDFYATGLRGSRAYVERHAGETDWMVLLDYVANRGLRLPREGSSTPALWEFVRLSARASGNGAVFPDDVQETITDDHTPFLRAGIPAVDLIDWSYPGHDVGDTIDKLSIESVDAVGETMMELIRRAGLGALQPGGG